MRSQHRRYENQLQIPLSLQKFNLIFVHEICDHFVQYQDRPEKPQACTIFPELHNGQAAWGSKDP